MMFVNLPVTDLPRAVAFYTALGFRQNPAFSDDNAACIVVEEDQAAFMLLLRDFFQTFTDRPAGDPSTTVSTMTSAGLANGGAEERPATDLGFMYQRQLSDPDGNVVELGWMDPAAAAQGPEAAAER
jgi:predicted lactoylglutathione lyase